MSQFTLYLSILLGLSFCKSQPLKEFDKIILSTADADSKILSLNACHRIALFPKDDGGGAILTESHELTCEAKNDGNLFPTRSDCESSTTPSKTAKTTAEPGDRSASVFYSSSTAGEDTITCTSADGTSETLTVTTLATGKSGRYLRVVKDSTPNAVLEGQCYEATIKSPEPMAIDLEIKHKPDQYVSGIYSDSKCTQPKPIFPKGETVHTVYVLANKAKGRSELTFHGKSFDIPEPAAYGPEITYSFSNEFFSYYDEANGRAFSIRFISNKFEMYGKKIVKDTDYDDFKKKMGKYPLDYKGNIYLTGTYKLLAAPRLDDPKDQSGLIEFKLEINRVLGDRWQDIGVKVKSGNVLKASYGAKRKVKRNPDGKEEVETELLYLGLVADKKGISAKPDINWETQKNSDLIGVPLDLNDPSVGAFEFLKSYKKEEEKNTPGNKKPK